MSTLTIPTGVAAVTAEWLTEALRPTIGPSARVSSFELTRIGEGVGFLGELGRTTLHYEGDPGPNAPHSVIVKLPTQVPEPRGMAAALGFYEREIGFYNEIGQDVGVRIPKAYHAVFQAADANFALIMEDVQGAKAGDQLASCSLDQAKLAVRELARLHARWWESPRLSTFSWLPSRGHQFYQFLKFGHNQALPAFRDQFASHFDPAILRCVEGLGAKYDEYLETLFGKPLTLTHSDYRLDNMMFGSAGTPEEFVLLDWQLCQASVGVLDLQYFVSGNLTKDVIAASTEELLDMYHEALRQGGITDYSRQDLAADYAEASLILGFYLVTGVTTMDPNAYSERGHDLIEQLFGSLTDSMLRYEAERYLPV
jgi:aminoglycoside phosphotransferase (APT) family kinase protein